ncbi:MAG TPA: phosphate-starvation-inducible PsiE family protein [Anaerolineae bacterium]|nr:phosphate-starvation-inducible PsiE family protein [Anaerolineae bacterium]
MDRALRVLEKVVVFALVAMMALIILLSTAELGWIIVKDIITPPYVLPGITELLDIFGFFLLILIGIELLETIRAYLAEHVIHVEVVLEVALIAVARKVIILDVKDYPSLTILAIGALILALSVAFFVERRARSLPHGSRPWPPK